MIEIIPNWHPVFVHFTVAMLIIAAAIHLLSRFLPNGELANQLEIVARWNLRLGVGFTLLTVAAGWYAYSTVAHDAPSHIAMTEHRNWAMATFALFLGVAGWEYFLSRRGKSKNRLFTGLLVIAAGLLLTTAWHGGELVYRYGLGVMSLPKPEGPDRVHEHGEDHGVMPAQGVDALHEGGAGTVPGETGHTHAPGTPPHED